MKLKSSITNIVKFHSFIYCFRKDKQLGWSAPDNSRSRSRTAKAVERFLHNLTRPMDQRNHPIPKKRPSSSLSLPTHIAPALEKGGKMKVTLLQLIVEPKA